MRADGWMDGWLAVKIMLNLRVTDPLIGLVLPPQIHLFPLAGDGVKRRLQRACTCAAADLPDGERKEEECVKPTAAWQSLAVELRLRRRFGTMRMKIALGGRTSAVAVAWRIRRSRLRRPCGRVRDAGDSPGWRVGTLFRSSNAPGS